VHVLPSLSNLADRGLLWMAICAVLALRRGPTRRAAARAVASMAIASTAVNVVAKPAFGRRRPATFPSRRLRRPPVTASFPSGHSASAAAVATAVALEAPALAAPLGVLAGAVGWSRVTTGVHYPSDVAAGFGLGTVAALATTRWWPVRPPVPAAGRPAVDAPALPAGDGLTVVVNAHAGTVGAVAQRIGRQLPAARVQVVEDPTRLDECLRAAAASATALGIAGGDGSVRLAAAVAAECGLPLAVFPAGTFNHFALDIGVRSAGAAADAVRAGHAVAVELASVNDHVFVNTASIGGYPELVRHRRHLQPRVGRWPALALALLTVMRDARPVTLRLDGARLAAWMLFVGNGLYHPPGFAPAWRSDLTDGLLDVRMVRADRPASRLRVVTAALTGTLSRSDCYATSVCAGLSVELDEPRELAVDGEVMGPVTTVEFGKLPTPLVVYRPFDRDLSTQIGGLAGPA
jgi:undecaprenyl-diphosphatase